MLTCIRYCGGQGFPYSALRTSPVYLDWSFRTPWSSCLYVFCFGGGDGVLHRSWEVVALFKCARIIYIPTLRAHEEPCVPSRREVWEAEQASHVYDDWIFRSSCSRLFAEVLRFGCAEITMPCFWEMSEVEPRTYVIDIPALRAQVEMPGIISS